MSNELMNCYVFFGAGNIGMAAIDYIGSDKIECFVDNDPQKDGKTLGGILIRDYALYRDQIGDKQVVITVAQEREEEIEEQLKKDGLQSIRFSVLKRQIIKKRIQERPDYLGIYKNAIQWIKTHTIPKEGIINSTQSPKSYPEVTGYYIPTLLRWGYRDLAIQYAKWLCSIQKADGSWYDTGDSAPYVFDSAQILKGLIEIREILPEVDASIVSGCDWIISNVQENGQLKTPCSDAWGEDKDTCDEVIHLYCLSPLMEAAEIFGKPEYREKARKVYSYYIKEFNDKIMNFRLLSHFYAYLMEALVDIGEIETAKEAMRNIEKFQKADGAVPGYNNVNWICTPGLFQLALVWYRIGDLERGDKAFAYACKLQNKTGGWFGSYPSTDFPDEINTYLPDAEISWAVKYFLDALYYKGIAEFDQCTEIFLDTIDSDDGRYVVMREEIKKSVAIESKQLSILDVGCGKGRYIKRLMQDFSEEQYYAVDLCKYVMASALDESVDQRAGTLTCLPYEDDLFDVVYTCEALEHSIDIPNAIKEMARVTRKGGKIIVIDKNVKDLGSLEIAKWEQWFDEEELSLLMRNYCTSVEVSHDLRGDGRFSAWVGIVA